MTSDEWRGARGEGGLIVGGLLVAGCSPKGPGAQTRQDQQCQDQSAEVIRQNPQRSQQPEDVAPQQQSQRPRKAVAAISQGRKEAVGQGKSQQADK